MIRLPRTKDAECTTEIQMQIQYRYRHLCFFYSTGLQARCIQTGDQAATEKNREENKFSSRVEVRDCDPESFRDRDQASGLNASFSSLIFSLLLSFSLPSTIPPFQSATCGDV